MTAAVKLDERARLAPQSETKRWLDAFEAVLRANDAATAAELFLPDGLWRDVLAFTWNIETASGRADIAQSLGDTLTRTRARNFHLPPRRTPPRWVTRAGQETIEALFAFDSAFGPGSGVLRLV